MESTNETVARAVNAARAGAFLKEFDGYAKAAIGDIKRQCEESRHAIEVQGKRLLSQSTRSGDSDSWCAISGKLKIFEGLVGSILRDIDHAMSR